MTRTPLMLALVAAAALAGCNKQSHTIVAGPDGVDDNTADVNLADVKLPPSITASHIYRCKDNSVLYIDWLSDNTARVRTSRTEVGTSYPVGEGQPVQGSADAKSVSYKGKTCNV